MEDNEKLSWDVAGQLVRMISEIDLRDFYTEVSKLIKTIENNNNISEFEAHKILIKSATYLEIFLNGKDINNAVKSYPSYEYLVAMLSEYVRLLLYPILNGYKIVGKTNEDFNINFDFFHEIFFTPKHKNDENRLPTFYAFNDYTFEGSRLSSFSLKNIEHNIIYYYNDDYEQTSIEFLGGEKVAINVNKIDINSLDISKIGKG